MIRARHRGLAAARNAGIEAASGDIVAFIDADARADRDWLYHLVEAITRRGAAAAGGPNFAPPDSTHGCVRRRAGTFRARCAATATSSTQLCGCNMAITKAALAEVGGFDPIVHRRRRRRRSLVAACRVAGRKRAPLVDAPGAVVIHERRADARAIISASSAATARGEGLLLQKVSASYRRQRAGLYGGAGRGCRRLLGGPRVYYGAFGRGLFQIVYAGADLPWLAELPHTFQWVAASVILAMAGALSPLLGTLGMPRHHHMDRDRDSVRDVRRCRRPRDSVRDARHPRDAVPRSGRWCGASNASACAFR